MTPEEQSRRIIQFARSHYYYPESQDESMEEQFTEALAARDRRIAELEHMLRNLLARIHRDGGHYVEEHGLAKAVEDGDKVVVGMQGQIAELEKALEPFAAMADVHFGILGHRADTLQAHCRNAERVLRKGEAS